MFRKHDTDVLYIMEPILPRWVATPCSVIAVWVCGLCAGGAAYPVCECDCDTGGADGPGSHP